MAKAKYILVPGATGDIHTSGSIQSDGSKKTKFELSKAETLTQDDLEHLYENNHTSMIMKVEATEVKTEKPKAKEK